MFNLLLFFNSAYTHTGGDNQGTFGGRVILVIKLAFGLRTRRAFWLEDEDEVVRTLDRDMKIGAYTLHLDDGNCKFCSQL